MKLMIRPCFLVVDRETSNGISTRKLIIETAKFNVITAYNSKEALETLKKYPNLDGVVTDSGMADMPCDELVKEIKKQNPKMMVVVVSTPRGGSCHHADHNLESFNPRLLLDLLQKLEPEAAASIERRNEDLEDGLVTT